MKKFLNFSICRWRIVFLLSFVGCAGTIHHDPAAFNSIDERTGVMLDCASPIGAKDVAGHLIQIDGETWVQVAPKSLKIVYLAPGTHTFKFISAGSKTGSQYYPGYEILKDKYYTYGIPVETTVKIKKGGLRKVKYTGPFWEHEQGKVEIEGYSVILPK